MCLLGVFRADSRFVPNQWETPFLCNDISHCLGAILESALGVGECEASCAYNFHWIRFGMVIMNFFMPIEIFLFFLCSFFVLLGILFAFMAFLSQNCTVQCFYNVVHFLPNPRKRHPIAHPLRWGMGCLLWVQLQIYIVSQFLPGCMQKHVISDCAIMALDWIRPNQLFDRSFIHSFILSINHTVNHSMNHLVHSINHCSSSNSCWWWVVWIATCR